MSLREYEALTAGTTTYSADRYGPKVLGLGGGRCLKLFRRKRLLSSSALIPYAKRFAVAAERLAQRGVRCVRVRRVVRVPSIHRHLVEYDYLAGETLRSELVGAMARPARLAELLSQHAAFIARLHRLRVYFRAVHFNNVIVCPDGELGLIDISEAHVGRLPLTAAKRARNFRPMVKYDEDRAALLAYGVERFIGDYLAAAQLSARGERRFRRALARIDPLLAGTMSG